MTFWSCGDDCACTEDCSCTDDYSASGTGGAGRSCPFINGDLLTITGGELIGTAGTTIVFDENGPDTDLVATTLLTIVCQPSDSDGPSTIQLRAGIDGSSYVYGQLAMTGGNVTLSVGTNAGELESNDDAGTGGIAEPITLELCYKPPVETGETAGIRIGAESRTGGTDWNDPDNVIGHNDDVYAWHGPLSEGSQTPAIGVHFFPNLPSEATIVGFAGEVRVRQTANPGNAPVVSSAIFTAGGVTGDNKATDEAVPNPDFAKISWGGPSDLWSITTTTADVNDDGVSFAVRFRFTENDTGDIDVDHLLCTIYFTAPDKSPGRITLTYTKGVTIECVTTQTTLGEGGGFPGLSFIADTWDVTSTAIECNSDSCEASCGDPVDCSSDCCSEEGSDGFTEEMVVSGFSTGVSACCSHVEGDYTLEFNTSPQGNNGCAWIYRETVDGCEPFEDGNAFHVDARIWKPVPPDGDCHWDVDISCFDGLDLSFSVKYRSAAIVDDECDAFPVTLNKHSELNPDGVTLPGSITLDNT